MEMVIDSKMDREASEKNLSQTLKMCKSIPNL